MSIASSVTAGFLQVASAMNARAGRVGMSAYDQAKQNGFVGTFADWQASLPGQDEDYAAYLLSLLGPVQTAGVATEAQAGATQLATATEVLAGITTKAMSPGRAPIRAFPSIVTLSASAAGPPPDGSLATLPAISTASGILLPSLWRFYAAFSKWVPAVPLEATAAGVLTDIKAWLSLGGIYFYPRETLVRVTRDPANSANGWNEYVWIGATTGFLLWNGVYSGAAYGGGLVDEGGNGTFLFARGEWMDVHIAGYANGGAVGGGTALLTVGADAAALFSSFLHGAVQPNSGSWAPAEFYIAGTNVRTLTTGVPSLGNVQIEGSYRRTVPTA